MSGTSHVGSFGLRDFLQLSAEILPTLSLFGLPEPDLIPAAFSAELLPAEFGNESERTVSVNGKQPESADLFPWIQFGNLQLDVNLYFLSHLNFLVWV